MVDGSPRRKMRDPLTAPNTMPRYPKILYSALAALALLMATWAPAHADSAAATTIPSADLIQPSDLAAALRSGTTPKPLILQVGFRTLFEQAHIPGSEYVGAASDSKGARALRERLARLPRDTAIVIYCGCCPWTHCPNMGAAYRLVHELGFVRLKALYIADNFGSDWVDKGFPVAKGS